MSPTVRIVRSHDPVEQLSLLLSPALADSVASDPAGAVRVTGAPDDVPLVSTDQLPTCADPPPVSGVASTTVPPGITFASAVANEH
ncbi:MAG: hypothetical protein ACLP50_10150 [Solirubrobacteraceae bacterium]